MFNDIKGVFNGKTAVGIVLFVLAFASTFWGNVQDLFPAWMPSDLVVTILNGLPGILILFGVWDSAQDEFENVKIQIKAFIASSPAMGIVLNIVIQLIDQLPNFPVPDWVQTVGLLVGGVLVSLGLKGNTVAARKNFKPLPVLKANKYAKAA
jgi:hypothetical protein